MRAASAVTAELTNPKVIKTDHRQMNLATTPSQRDLEEFAEQRELVADEISRIAEAANVAPERLALGLCAFPQGTTAGAWAVRSGVCL